MSEHNIQFKKGVLELSVLALLGGRDCYGYELVEAISRRIEISEGTIYPLLRRLKHLGYCETYLKESHEGPPRKYYRITKPGRAFLAHIQDEWQLFVTSINRLIEEGIEHD